MTPPPPPRLDAPVVTTQPKAGRAPVWAWALLLAAGVAVAIFLFQGDAGAPGGGKKGRGAGGPQVTPVSVAPVVQRDFDARARYPGELDADAADVAADVGGRLVRVDVRLGDAVSAGAPLAAVDDATLQAQRGELVAQVRAARAAGARAHVALGAARTELTRVTQLAAQGVASQQTVDAAGAEAAGLDAASSVARADRARAQARLDALDLSLTQTVIRAPFDGIVTRRLHDPGGYVQAGAPVVRLVARAPLRVRFDVPEEHAAELRTGAAVVARAAATGARDAAATVTGIAPEVDRERRVIRVEATVDDPPQSWFPGMYATVEAARLSLPAALVVPEPALLSRLLPSGQVEDGVFVARHGAARWVTVRVLGRESGDAAVAGGLAVGDQVLVGGHADLADGAPIQVPTAAP